jgi:hypothetical protein
MQDFQIELSQAVGKFVSQISTLARQVAIDSLERALGGTSTSPTSNRARSRNRRSDRTRGALAASFVEFVTKNPGMRMEQINAKLGTTTHDLAGPVRKLLADGEIKRKGHRRSTTYFPA